MQDPELGEYDLVPVGPCPDDAGEAADAVGERAGAGIDEASGDVVPCRIAGERRIGEPGAQAVVEPAIEVDQPAAEAFDALVTGALPLGGVGMPTCSGSFAGRVSSMAGAAPDPERSRGT